MEHLLQYFRDAIHRPTTVASWADWWQGNDEAVRESFPRLEYLRLKKGALVAAEDYLRRTNQLLDPIRLDDRFLARLHEIEWFIACREPGVELTPGVIQAHSSEEASAALFAPSTRALRQGPSIDLYNFVGGADRDFHRRWNDRARALNSWLDSSGLDRIWRDQLSVAGLGLDFLPAIRSDILWAAINNECLIVPGCPEDGLRVFSWYIRGRVVCGWQGDWPDGYLVVF